MTNIEKVREALEGAAPNPISVEAIAEMTGLTRAAVSSAMHRLRPLHPEITKADVGVYWWNNADPVEWAQKARKVREETRMVRGGVRGYHEVNGDETQEERAMRLADERGELYRRIGQTDNGEPLVRNSLGEVYRLGAV